MVIFDILASHHRMLAWHERSIEAHLAEMASLQRQQIPPEKGETTVASAGPSVVAGGRQSSADGGAEVDAAGDSSPAEAASPTEAETGVEGGLEAEQRHTLDRR